MEQRLNRARLTRGHVLLAVAASLMLAVPAGLVVMRGIEKDRPRHRADITAREIAAHVRYLASDALAGRRAGTEGAEKAAHYIASEFRTYGLRPLGKEGGFHQTFRFVSEVRVGEGNLLELRTGAEVRAFQPGRDFLPLPFSHNEDVEAEVVFAGFGISAPELGYDDYAGVDVRGKIVVVFTGSPDGDDPHSRFTSATVPRAKVVAAREKGARGILFIASEQAFEDDPLTRLRYDHAFGDSGIVACVISQPLANEMLAKVGKRVTDLRRELGERKEPVSFVLPHLWLRCRSHLVKESKTTSNVVGLVAGRDPLLSNEYIIIGAHYDHLGLGGADSLAPRQKGEIHNGADDNASGVAGLLELAEALAAERHRLRRSVLCVAFSGEEEGLLGSRAFVTDPPVPLDRVIAMINLDMVGRLKDNSLIIYGQGTSPVWGPLLERLNTAARFNITAHDDGVGPSDHTSFYLKNIPVLHFFTGVHEDYHKPSDDAEKINAEGERRIIAFVRDLVMELERQPQRPPFTRTATSERDRVQTGFRVSIGTIPDYAADVEGVRLAGVRPNSPAEKAGLKPGDIIVRVGSQEVRNVYDYTYALQNLRPDQEVDFVIRRDGERLILRVVARRR